MILRGFWEFSWWKIYPCFSNSWGSKGVEYKFSDFFKNYWNISSKKNEEWRGLEPRTPHIMMLVRKRTFNDETQIFSLYFPNWILESLVCVEILPSSAQFPIFQICLFWFVAAIFHSITTRLFYKVCMHQGGQRLLALKPLIKYK